MIDPKFRYYDQFNGVFVYSDKFNDLAEFFTDYRMASEGCNNPILQQSTGIVDKSERLIYQGDVIVYTNGQKRKSPKDGWMPNASDPFSVIDVCDISYLRLVSHNSVDIVGNIFNAEDFRI